MKEQNNNEPSFGIIAQYVKDISFESVTPITKMNVSANRQPEIDVQFRVEYEKDTEENIYNVGLITKIKAAMDNVLFVVEVNYVGCFAISGVDEKMLMPLIHIECANLLFPFARAVIAGAVSDGGYPPLYLSPVNFLELYEKNVGKLQETMQ